MKKIFTFFTLFIFTIGILSGNDPTVNRKFKKIFNYGERIARINYDGDTTYQTYFLISCDTTKHEIRKTGIGYEVQHPNIQPDTGKTWSFISNGKREIKKAITQKGHIAIMLVENKYHEYDRWKFVPEDQVILY